MIELDSAPFKVGQMTNKTPCGHEVTLPYEVMGKRVLIGCETCTEMYYAEVIDTQGTYTLRWYVDGDPRAASLRASVNVLIDAYGYGALSTEVERHAPMRCPNCGLMIAETDVHRQMTDGKCSVYLKGEAPTEYVCVVCKDSGMIHVRTGPDTFEPMVCNFCPSPKPEGGEVNGG